MEFHEKLQELRKQKGLTQEELAESLYVSRSAVSKWEAGRGYPGIDSLKAISAFFSVSVDTLLSSDEVLVLAEQEQQLAKTQFRDLVFGLLDCSIALLLFLPFFGQQADGTIHTVSLMALTETPPYLMAAYISTVIAMAIWGVLTLALQNCRQPVWTRSRTTVSLLLNSVGVLLFIISQQPYAAVLVFVFLMIKVLTLLKKQ